MPSWTSGLLLFFQENSGSFFLGDSLTPSGMIMYFRFKLGQYFIAGLILQYLIGSSLLFGEVCDFSYIIFRYCVNLYYGLVNLMSFLGHSFPLLNCSSVSSPSSVKNTWSSSDTPADWTFTSMGLFSTSCRLFRINFSLGSNSIRDR